LSGPVGSRVSSAPAALALGSAAHLALMATVLWLDDDRAAALAAFTGWLVCLSGTVWGFGFRLLSAPAVYLAVFGVFHLGLATPWALGLSAGQLPSWLLHSRLTPALALVLAALWAFYLGVGAAAFRGAKSPHRRRPAISPRDDVSFHCGLVVTLLGCAALLWGVRMLGFERMANATYFETYRLARTYDPRFFVTSLHLVPMGLYLAAASASRPRLRLVAGFAVLWAICVFGLGFRGFALVPLVALATVFDKRGVRIPRAALAASVATALLAIPAVHSMRANPLMQRSMNDLAVGVRPFEALQEMGGSLRPLVHTIELMANEPYRRGTTYLGALRLIAPNLSLIWRGDDYLELEDLPPSHWVSKLAAPWSYRNYGGLGFSAVAEPYMNFGPAGVAGWFLLLGWGLARLDRQADARTASLAVLAMLLGPMLWATRNTMAVFFRPAVWGLAVALAASLLSRSLRSMRPIGDSQRRPVGAALGERC